MLPFRLPTALEFDFDAALFDDEGDVVADIPKIWGVDDELLIDILIPDSYFVMVSKVDHVDDLAMEVRGIWIIGEFNIIETDFDGDLKAFDIPFFTLIVDEGSFFAKAIAWEELKDIEVSVDASKADVAVFGKMAIVVVAGEWLLHDLDVLWINGEADDAFFLEVLGGLRDHLVLANHRDVFVLHAFEDLGNDLGIDGAFVFGTDDDVLWTDDDVNFLIEGEFAFVGWVAIEGSAKEFDLVALLNGAGED